MPDVSLEQMAHLQRQHQEAMPRNRKMELSKRGKVVCPACGRKTFVDYIYLDDRTPVASGQCGRCDRADNCGYHYPPKEYFQDLRDKGLDNNSWKHKSVRQRKEPVPNAPSYIDANVMLDSMCHYEMNPLVRYLHSLFDANAGVEIPDIVETICKRYCVGTSSRYGGSTVFWQFDQYGKVRSGQIIGYDSATGKRDHNKQNWVHSVMSDKYPNFDLRQCFFGSHLIRKADRIFDALNKEREAMNISGKAEPIIWLMESPKAALILAIALMWGGCNYTFVPMATCGCGGINLTPEAVRDTYDKHQILKGRKVVLFPDQGKFDEWKSKGEKLKGFCKEVWISTVMEKFHPHPIDCEIQGGDGFDDIIIRYVQQGKPIWDVIGHCYGYHGQNRIV